MGHDLGWCFYGVRTQIKGRLDGRGNGGRLTSFFLCPKMAKIVGGVTAGVTKWGYIFRKVGLHIRGFRG